MTDKPRLTKQENLIDERWAQKEESSRWFPFLQVFTSRPKSSARALKKWIGPPLKGWCFSLHMRCPGLQQLVITN
jgi:hypothetical protein